MGPTQGLADGAVVINLDDRTDRWKAFQERVAPQLGIDTVERLSAVRGTDLPGFGEPPFFHGRERDRTWAGRAGCALSHRAGLQRALQAGWQRVLVLEDDIELVPSFETVRDQLIPRLDALDWDVCYLGFTDPIGPFRKVAEIEGEHVLYQIYGCNTAHGYLLKRRACEILLQTLPEEADVWNWLTRHRAIDRWYSRVLSRQLAVLALSPSVVNQYDGVSDITGRTYEKEHHTRITGMTSGNAAYRIQTMARRMHFALEGGYDTLRGVVKRHRGF